MAADGGRGGNTGVDWYAPKPTVDSFGRLFRNALHVLASRRTNFESRTPEIQLVALRPAQTTVCSSHRCKLLSPPVAIPDGNGASRPSCGTTWRTTRRRA